MAKSRGYLKNDEETREFVKVLDGIDRGRSTWEVFDDFTTVSACAISNAADRNNYDQREAEYMRIAKRYTSEQMKAFAELFALTTLAINDDPERDFLGDLYGGLDLLDTKHQQYFTPYHISHLMASLSMSDRDEKFERNGFIDICDPTCGSGTMLIAAANVLRQANRNLATEALFVGKDIDRRVAKMCYITLSLMGVAAVVHVCNALSFEPIPKSSTWVTPALIREDIWVERGYTVRAENAPGIAA